ncbi:MAG: preprotein translocase subunit SecE [Bacteroidales bacterium]|nr:preprotein translocase subunit SecE [Bacteroidales bacterium]
MTKIKTYFEESYNELVNKVTWPSWKDLQSSGIVVMVASFMIAIVIALMDTFFRNVMEVIYNMF